MQYGKADVIKTFVSPSLGNLQVGNVGCVRGELAACRTNGDYEESNRGSYTICPGSGTDLRIPSAWRIFWVIASKPLRRSGGAMQSTSGGRVLQVRWTSQRDNVSQVGISSRRLGAQDKNPAFSRNPITCGVYVRTSSRRNWNQLRNLTLPPGPHNQPVWSSLVFGVPETQPAQ